MNPEPRLRILCGEPQNYSVAGLDAVRAIADLDAEPLTQAAFAERAPAYDVLMVRLQLKVTKEMLAAAPRLRAILTPTTGLNHIAMDVADEQGVEVFHLRGHTDFLRTITSTAEHTWGLLLALVRNTPVAFDAVKAGTWVQRPYRGRELKGKRLGILGHGRLGSIVGQYGAVFGMQVLTYDPYIDAVPDPVVRVETLEDLFAQSDVLSVHVPLNTETEGMIGAAELAHLPKGAFVVNTARGEIIDEVALCAALESGQIAGVAVDVLGQEHRIPGHGHVLIDYARQHTNVVITPHIGGAAWEAIEQTDLYIIRRFIARLTELGTAG